MNVLTGSLFGCGLTALLLAAALMVPIGTGPAWVAAGLVVVGLGAMVTSWSLLFVRHGDAEARLHEASLRLEDWAADLGRARAALAELADAERSLHAGGPAVDGADLLAEALDRLATAPPEAHAAVHAAYEGLALPSPPAPIGLEALVARAETLASAVAGREITAARTIAPHAEVALDRARVASLLARVLLAAEGDPAPRLDVGEWQAGLLRVQVTSSHPVPPAGGLKSGLRIAAAQARTMAGSLEWTTSEQGARYVLLLPLDDADVATDPGV